MERMKLFLRIYGDRSCRLTQNPCQPDAPAILQEQINLTGPGIPKIPEGRLSEPQYLRWKAALMEKGFQIEEPCR